MAIAFASAARIGSVTLAALTLAIAGSAASAAVVQVGSISIEPIMTTTNGVQMTAHWTLNQNWSNQTCCTTLAWLQSVTTTNPAGFSPTPNRTFIDLKNDVSQGGDNMPPYDFTYPSDPNAAGGPPALSVPAGTGAWIFDKPALNAATSRPNTFTAKTYAVCVLPNNKYAILAGFSWGFSITAAGVVTPAAVGNLGDTAADRAALNTALGLDFPGFSMADSTTVWPDQFTFSVPAPGVLPLLAGGTLLALRRRRCAA